MSGGVNEKFKTVENVWLSVGVGMRREQFEEGNVT